MRHGNRGSRLAGVYVVRRVTELRSRLRRPPTPRQRRASPGPVCLFMGSAGADHRARTTPVGRQRGGLSSRRHSDSASANRGHGGTTQRFRQSRPGVAVVAFVGGVHSGAVRPFHRRCLLCPQGNRHFRVAPRRCGFAETWTVPHLFRSRFGGNPDTEQTQSLRLRAASIKRHGAGPRHPLARSRCGAARPGVQRPGVADRAVALRDTERRRPARRRGCAHSDDINRAGIRAGSKRSTI